MRIFFISIQLVIVFIATQSYALEIAPTEKALSLAQFEREDKVHTLLVVADNDSAITGIDISAKTGVYPEDCFDLVLLSADSKITLHFLWSKIVI